MVSQDSLLVMLVQVVDRLPQPKRSSKRKRGHPAVYSDRLFLKGIGHHDRSSPPQGP